MLVHGVIVAAVCLFGLPMLHYGPTTSAVENITEERAHSQAYTGTRAADRLRWRMMSIGSL